MLTRRAREHWAQPNGTAQNRRDELHRAAASCPLELRIEERSPKLAFLTCMMHHRRLKDSIDRCYASRDRDREKPAQNLLGSVYFDARRVFHVVVVEEQPGTCAIRTKGQLQYGS